MDTEKLVQLVVAEVLRQLKEAESRSAASIAAEEHKALAIFTGGTIGLETSLEQLSRLQAIGTEPTVILSEAAECIIGINWIKEKLGSHVNVITTQSPYPGKYLRSADIVLVPVLTQNTAAKLAHTFSDTMVSTVILQALMLGKPVIAAKNAADPKDNWRVQKNMANTNPALKEALEENLKKLEAYGIELVSAEGLAVAVKNILIKEALPKLPCIQEKNSKRHVLDADTVRQAAKNGAKMIQVKSGTVITPLARDIARENSIDIINQ